MLPGPMYVIACPSCKGLAKYESLISGNTFGARLYSDGKEIAPMLPRLPAIVKCDHCEKLHWLSDFEEIGSYELFGEEPEDVNPDWLSASVIEEPSEDDYYRAIAENFARIEQQEKNLRILTWWRRNDAYRHNLETQDELVYISRDCRENLEALVDLLAEQDDNECIMKAEILRELGEFDQAKKILHRLITSDFSNVVNELLSLCEKGDTCVRELPGDS